jgi:hypothetical protein
MSLSRRLSDLQNSLRAQATPRALAGLALLIGIVAIVALSDLNMTVNGLRAGVGELKREQRLEIALLNDQSWIEQADEIEADLARVQESFWRGSTPGIVAARLQGVVESAARDAALEFPRVSVQAEPSDLGANAQLFEIELRARDLNGQFLAVFQNISRAENNLTITGFEWSRLNGQLVLRIEAPALIEAEASRSTP